jgi:uncharacterized protein
MRKNKYLIIILLTVIVLIMFFFIFSNNFFRGTKSSVVINGKEIEIEVVSTEKEKAKGLGGRNSLCDSCGMLFKFASMKNHSFWMKDMKFPLDIIWIFNDKIVYIAKNVPPDYQGIITPPMSANRVLELNGGICDKENIKEGDIINF